ncbi:hypothetical protein KXS07_31485 [Inquilinus limosus]|uniref:hypothetical protein n=1 Tax=Inquilinus limosus TaxID=171674 RepID=UPI003F1912CC
MVLTPRTWEARRVEKLREGDRLVAEMVQGTLDALREEAREQYNKLLEQYRGTAAAVGIFGVGSVTLAVVEGQIQVNPPADRVPPLRGRGALYPETLVAISEGQMTILDAFHRGELVARANAEDLHRAYDSFTEVTEVAIRSSRIREVVSRFSKEMHRRTTAD